MNIMIENKSAGVANRGLGTVARSQAHLTVVLSTERVGVVYSPILAYETRRTGCHCRQVAVPGRLETRDAGRYVSWCHFVVFSFVLG